MEEIILARYRAGEFGVNYNNGGKLESFKWSGAKGKQIDKKPIPKYIVDWLLMDTTTISDGHLVIVSDDKESKQIKENIGEDADLDNNTHTHEEIESILTGNFPKMKSALNKITKQAEKDFVIEVAQEIKIDSVGKRNFLAEWVGIDAEILFADVDSE